MADVSGWDAATPSGSSLVSKGDDKFRSLQSDIQAGMEEEHYWTENSGVSGGEHKIGSARAYHGPASEVSSSDRDGDIMVTSDSKRIIDVGPAGPEVLGGWIRPGAPSSATDPDGTLNFYIHEYPNQNTESVVTFDVAYSFPPTVVATVKSASTSDVSSSNSQVQVFVQVNNSGESFFLRAWDHASSSTTVVQCMVLAYGRVQEVP